MQELEVRSPLLLNFMNICKYKELQLPFNYTEIRYTPFSFKGYATSSCFTSYKALQILLLLQWGAKAATQALQALHTAVFSPCLFLAKQFSFAVLRVLSLSKKVPLYLQTSQTAGRLQPTSAPYGQQQPTLPFLSTWAETLLNIHKTASSSVL